MIDNIGSIYKLSFPYTDASGEKIRPVVIVIESGKDYEVLYMTSKPVDDGILILPTDLQSGALEKESYIKLSKASFFDKRLFSDAECIAVIKLSKMREIMQRFIMRYEYVIEKIDEEL
jgi:hypothetical protein